MYLYFPPLRRAAGVPAGRRRYLSHTHTTVSLYSRAGGVTPAIPVNLPVSLPHTPLYLTSSICIEDSAAATATESSFTWIFYHSCKAIRRQFRRQFSTQTAIHTHVFWPPKFGGRILSSNPNSWQKFHIFALGFIEMTDCASSNDVKFIKISIDVFEVFEVFEGFWSFWSDFKNLNFG